jgi:hypothetical protein
MERFLQKYSQGNTRFDDVKYRAGARITCHFGLEEGYTVQPDKSLKFDTVRIHTGVDRSGLYGNKDQRIENVVISPFDFNRSNTIFYGADVSYGNLIQLFNDQYGFEMRIAHMSPLTDILPDIKTKLSRKAPIKQNEVLGKAGNFGISGGTHTHTEFLSTHTECNLFENILISIHGLENVVTEYSKMDVLKIYQNKQQWVGKSAQEVFAHYEKLKKDRGITFLNKYKYMYNEAGTNIIRTRYSSELLFNGL